MSGFSSRIQSFAKGAQSLARNGLDDLASGFGTPKNNWKRAESGVRPKVERRFSTASTASTESFDEEIPRSFQWNQDHKDHVNVAAKDHGRATADDRSKSSFMSKLVGLANDPNLLKVMGFVAKAAPYVMAAPDIVKPLTDGFGHARSVHGLLSDPSNKGTGRAMGAAWHAASAGIAGVNAAALAAGTVSSQTVKGFTSDSNKKLNGLAREKEEHIHTYELARRRYDEGIFTGEINLGNLKDAQGLLAKLRDKITQSELNLLSVQKEYDQNVDKHAKTFPARLAQLGGVTADLAGAASARARKASAKISLKSEARQREKQAAESRLQYIKNPELLLRELVSQGFQGTYEQLSSALRHDPELHDAVFGYLFAQDSDVD